MAAAHDTLPLCWRWGRTPIRVRAEMRTDILLNVASCALAIKFYVDEFGMFEIAADYGMNAILLHATGNPGVCLQISERAAKTAGAPLFGMSVDSCDSEFERLTQTVFSSGARLVPDRDGKLAVFEWPGGKSFLLEDPSRNQFMLFEDRIAP
ncbi:VOC family protein [Massilia antarctica]|uniref:VOC family protein n=1 Tax=Massilia antarctica TaxID=2765360 RepID=A0AA48WI63_9BURK|nr:VOC family protein [Massilia antarctica]QPI52049.1 VOC family protein [Massilia antarctica]